MTHSFRHRLAGAGLVALGALALATSTPAGRQLPEGFAARLLVDSVALPGLDRGLAPHDLTADPVDRSARAASFQNAAGESSERYARGSVIVKFRDGTGPARDADLRAVGGRDLTRPAHADCGRR